MNYLGRTLIFFGLILIAGGVLLQVLGKVPGIGRLPGDLYVRKGPVTFYFPLATSLILSLLLSLIVSLLWRR